MNQLSVVIITLNEENRIADCIRSAKNLSSDVIVIDSGSSDKTIEYARSEGAAVFSVEWQSYGHARNAGAAKAQHDWILALDADERLSPELIASIQKTDLSNREYIFRCRRKNFIANKPVRFGTMGRDKVARIYNRNFCKWDLTLVHEKLESGGRIKMINGYLLHYPFESLHDYKTKLVHYAEMSAMKYFIEDRNAGFVKRFLAPVFNSIRSYIFHLGFLEGKRGFAIAKIIAYYTWLKYFYLSKLIQNKSAEARVHLQRV